MAFECDTGVRGICSKYWRYIVTWLTPILLLPLPIVLQNQISLCGYMMLIMCVYWVTEAIPLGVTGLVPVVLAPLLGILTLKDVCANYLSDTVMFFTGAIVVALAVEKSKLHKRIALTVLIHMGTNLKMLLLGFSLTTCLISFFITNTATVAMMLPIVDALLNQLENIDTTTRNEQPETKNIVEQDTKFDKLTEEHDVQDTCVQIVHRTSEKRQESWRRQHKRFGKCMTLMSTYAAQCGGTAALTGCSTNVIMKGFADKFWKEHGFDESPVTYASWLLFGVPISVTNIFIIYIWMTAYHLGVRSLQCHKSSKEEQETNAKIKHFLIKERESLGSLRFSEIAVTLLFTILVLLWFFRSPGFMDGWGVWFPKSFVGSATPTILIVLILFAIPSENTSTLDGKSVPLMDWDTVHTRMPWNLVFLMGGGFALADACHRSGLSVWMGGHLSFLTGLNTWLLVLILCIFVCFFTELISNPATCSILMPIVASMAESIGKNPLYLMFPTVTCSSFAFMLPVASPQNALTFTSGRIKMTDMMKAGFILNIFCIFSVTIATQTYGYLLFDFGTPPWVVNTTIVP